MEKRGIEIIDIDTSANSENTNYSVNNVNQNAQNEYADVAENVTNFVVETVLEKPIELVHQLSEQLNECRGVIDENTNEVAASYELIASLDRKLNFVQARLEAIESLFGKQDVEKSSSKILPLTVREKEFFHALYVLSCEFNNAVSYRQLAQRMLIDVGVVSSYITALLAKGIPLFKRYSNGTVIVSLDQDFRQKQAKENLVGVNTLLSYWMR